MDPKKQRAKLEKDHELELRRLMRTLGWHTEKTHGSLFRKGFPDLFCMHPTLGPGSTPIQRWVEMKRPGQGELEESQKVKFRLWTNAGVGIWVLSSAADYDKLFKPANWHWWLDPELRKLL